jgi:hypothetical protein
MRTWRCDYVARGRGRSSKAASYEPSRVTRKRLDVFYTVLWFIALFIYLLVDTWIG